MLGLVLGWWSLDWLTSLGLSDLPRAHEIRLDGMVIAFTLGLAVAARRRHRRRAGHAARGHEPQLVLRDEGRTGTRRRGHAACAAGSSSRRWRWRSCCSWAPGLLLASFRQLLAVDPGFRAEHVRPDASARCQTQYPDDAALAVLRDARAGTDPRAAGRRGGRHDAAILPFSWDDSSSVIIAEGYVPAPGESVVSPNQLYVTPGYLEAMGVPLKRGRFFSTATATTRRASSSSTSGWPTSSGRTPIRSAAACTSRSSPKTW